MSDIVVRKVQTRREKNIFLTFPWRIYRGDPLWVPPLLPERKKVIDPKKGKFFEDGYADLFIAWRGNQPVGTISCGEDLSATRSRDFGESNIGFFECIDDYAVAEALLDQATAWTRTNKLVRIIGTYNLDREDSRGILIEGRDRPASVYCGYNPSYYQTFLEQYGFTKFDEDGLAYAIDLDLKNPEIAHLVSLAEGIRKHKPNIKVRGANLKDIDGEIDRIVDLQNRGLAHFPNFTPYTRASIEAMVLPMMDVVDPELVLFVEVDGKPAGWFPAVPNLNEIFIHLNGLRYPWDYLRALKYSHYKVKSIAIKSVVVPPEYWDTGVGVLLFDEMARRAIAKGYTWADMSLTGEYNKDTWPLAHRMGAKIYKRYRFYEKPIES
ncbi:MAG TPA: GNAT family N-acetyltransferase [Anaerolineales bacterium]|nr:GNAT family N-acetyltransferase [Anaerolineales bacterium]